MDPDEATPTEVEPAMSDAFGRLYWSIFEEVSKIRIIAEDLDRPISESVPFEGHPIAAEAASSPPLTEIAVYIDGLYVPEEEEDREDWEIDEPLSVRRADGGVVTIGDFVEQVSPYFIANKVVILRSKAFVTGTINPDEPIEEELLESYRYIEVLGLGGYISADKKVYFEGFCDDIEPETNSVSVSLWADGEWGESAEDHWG